MAPLLPIEEEYRIDDTETLKVLGDPLRIRILEQVARMNDSGQLATAKLLAEALEVPQTKLYYHLNLMEEHSLLLVAETGLVSGIVEKRYQIRARRLRADVEVEPDQGAFSLDEMEAILTPVSSFLDNALGDLKQAIQAYAKTSDDVAPPILDQIHLQQKRLHLTQEEAEVFTQRLEALITDFRHSPGGQRQAYQFISMFHPGQPAESNQQES